MHNRFLLAILFLLILFMLPGFVLGQDAEKLSARISLSYFHQMEESPYCTVQVRTRQGRKYEPVVGSIINLFLNEETKLGMMGNITTDEKGKGKYVFPEKFYTAFDTLTEFTFTARLLNDPEYKDVRKSITIRKSRLELEILEDTTAIGRIFSYDDMEKEIPVEEVEIKFLVQRMFSRLPIGEEFQSTDESGEQLLDFPRDLPGNKKGELTLIAVVEDHDDFGTLEIVKKVNWGVSLIEDSSFDKRTLWSSRDKVPFWLLIFPNLIIIGVWGVLFYLTFQLIKISKIGKSIE